MFGKGHRLAMVALIVVGLGVAGATAGLAGAEPYQCEDGYDNDGDWLVDYDDPGCTYEGDNDEYNAPPPPPQCGDGVDNDGDGYVDLGDPHCDAPSDNDESPWDPPPPPPPRQCADGADNDGDGYVDLDDPRCDAPNDNDETPWDPPPPPPQCADGVDNDGDSYVDLNDPRCYAAHDNDETPWDPPPPRQCTDGLDNDGDGRIDFDPAPPQIADPGCEDWIDDSEHDVIPNVQFIDDSRSTRWENWDGYWTIHKGCFGPSTRGGENVTVGPGYISQLLRKNFGGSTTQIVQDEREARKTWLPGNPVAQLNDPRYGGLGGFGLHLSRGTAGQMTLSGSNTWSLDGRTCAVDNFGFGVYSTGLPIPPHIDLEGNGAMAVDVWFKDLWGHTGYGPDADGDGVGDALLKVYYRYQIRPSVVKVWINVTEYCDNGCPIGPGDAFVKEPKIVSSVTNTDYKRIAVFDSANAIATDAKNNPCTWLSGATNADNITATNQCYQDNRTRVRFDRGIREANPGGCENYLCLNVVMRASTSNFESHLWESSFYGFDWWNILSDGRPAANSQDQGGNWDDNCHWGSPWTDPNREWELAGGLQNANFEYQAATVLFNAWPGGAGPTDCEPLARLFGPAGENWWIYGQYSIAEGWSIP